MPFDSQHLGIKVAASVAVLRSSLISLQFFLLQPLTKMFKLHNVNDGEDIYQRCLLITGQCEASNQQDTFVQVNTTNEVGIETFPSHRWPLCGGWFKCLVLLTPGKNIVKLSTGDGQHTTEASL